MSIKVEIDNVEEVVNRRVSKGGRITGLGDWEGQMVKILIIKNEPLMQAREQGKQSSRKV